MKKRMLIIALIAGSSGMAGAALADPVYGIWEPTKDDNGSYRHIGIAVCGVKILALWSSQLIPANARIQSENLGNKNIWNMTAQGDGAYGDGKVWSPNREKTYSI